MDPPKMMTIREVAATGLLTEHALRELARANRLPAIQVGNRMLINYTKLVDQLNALGCNVNMRSNAKNT